MSNIRLKKMTATALVAAIVFVVTFIVKIPIGIAGGYMNLGDTAIFIGAYMLGGFGGGIAASIGSALADVTASYFIYAPATFIIKGIMGLLCGLLSKRKGFSSFAVASILSGIIMVCGYFLYETLFFNMKQAIASLPFNACQFAVSVIAAMLLFPAAKRIKGNAE